MFCGSLLLNETYAIEVGMWLFGIPLLLVYLLLLKVLLTPKSRVIRILSAAFLCVLALLGSLVAAEFPLLLAVLVIPALLGVVRALGWMDVPESPDPGVDAHEGPVMPSDKQR